MEEIKIKVADKIASVEGTPIIICGNSDYVVNFTFDDEWADKNEKTAHFVYYQDGLKKNIPVDFVGDTCNVPVLVNTERVSIGVSASGMVTTTGAEVRCKKSILCEVDKEEQDLFEMGKNSVQNPLEYATTVASVFQNTTFPDGYNLTVALPNCQALTYFVYNSKGLKAITIKDLNENTALAMGYAFKNSIALETISFDDKTIKISNGIDTFRGTTTLKEIKGTLDLAEITNVNTMFEACTSLEYVRFKAETIKISISFSKCSKLTSETVQSIIDGLATVEEQQTLTVNGAILSSLTEEQMTTILNKNWVVQ